MLFADAGNSRVSRVWRVPLDAVLGLAARDSDGRLWFRLTRRFEATPGVVLLYEATEDERSVGDSDTLGRGSPGAARRRPVGPRTLARWTLPTMPRRGYTDWVPDPANLGGELEARLFDFDRAMKRTSDDTLPGSEGERPT